MFDTWENSPEAPGTSTCVRRGTTDLKQSWSLKVYSSLSSRNPQHPIKNSLMFVGNPLIFSLLFKIIWHHDRLVQKNGQKRWKFPEDLSQQPGCRVPLSTCFTWIASCHGWRRRGLGPACYVADGSKGFQCWAIAGLEPVYNIYI